MSPEALAEAYARAFPDGRGWSVGEFTQLLANPGTVFAGDARCFVLGRVILDEAEILTLATDPAFQRQGFAAKCLNAWENACFEGGARQVFLEVAEDNNPARALYNSAKYAQIGLRKGYYHGNIDGLILGKSLSDPKNGT